MATSEWVSAHMTHKPLTSTSTTASSTWHVTFCAEAGLLSFTSTRAITLSPSTLQLIDFTASVKQSNSRSWRHSLERWPATDRPAMHALGCDMPVPRLHRPISSRPRTTHKHCSGWKQTPCHAAFPTQENTQQCSQVRPAESAQRACAWEPAARSPTPHLRPFDHLKGGCDARGKMSPCTTTE
jgi:hypothetical protein